MAKLRNMDETFRTTHGHPTCGRMSPMGPNADAVSAYLASMPPEYRKAFDAEAIRAHEAIVRRRGGRETHVEIWRELSERVVAICVVAEDKPGLLSCISAALVNTRVDVVSAHAYRRTRADGTLEAIDFLWIRRLPNSTGVIPPIRARDIVHVADAIERAARTGSPDAEPIVSERLPTPSQAAIPLTGNASARIRFDNDPKDGTTILTVEAVDRPGLLLTVTQALFRSGLQIIGLRATTEQGAAVDRFHIAEVDGTPLKSERLLTLQATILGALDNDPADSAALSSA
jgi:UTP:GlnB (protein PII) uridylyltransferase